MQNLLLGYRIKKNCIFVNAASVHIVRNHVPLYARSMDARSLTGKRWIVAKNTEAFSSPEELVRALASERGIMQGATLHVRQYSDFPIAKALMERAISGELRAGIFGDYDCDGITGVSQLVRFLARHGVSCEMKLPHRLSEGYGLKPEHVDAFAKSGVTLLMTIDTGISCEAAIARAKELGMHVIIIDHHRVPEMLPDADAILHPLLNDPQMKAAPAAAGLAFQFVEALEGETWVDRDTDVSLAAMGTVADLVPLTGWNRALVQEGLDAMARLKDGAIGKLLAHAGIGSRPSSRDIGYRLAPRINAAGRMDDPTIALRAMLGDEIALAQLTDLNESRQSLVADLLEDALARARTEEALLFDIHADYTPGVVGLIAGRLTERYGKPSLVATRDGELCTASLRSVPGYDITLGLTKVQNYLVSFGGHAQAAGCTFRSEHAEHIRATLSADIATSVPKEALVPTVILDRVLTTKDVNVALCNALATLEPFGQANNEPKFLLENVLLNEVRACGENGRHLQARVSGVQIIGFHLGHLAQSALMPVDLAFHLSLNTWKEKVNAQIVLDDVRIAQGLETRRLETRESAQRV